MSKTNNEREKYRPYTITQEGLNAFIMQSQNATRAQAIEINRQCIKDFEQLPKGKVKA